MVPTSMVDARKTVRHYTWQDKADLDIRTSVNKIGEIVNLSQELNTHMWDLMNHGASFEDIEEIYNDAAQLDVLSGLEIDRAKKEFAINSVAEIRRMKKKYARTDERGRQIKPNFFGKIARIKGYYDSERKNYHFHDTAMDYLQHHLNRYKSPYNKETLPFSSIIKPPEGYAPRLVKYSQVKRIVALVREMRNQIKAVWINTDDSISNGDKINIVNQIRDECYQYIKSIKLNPHTAYRLLLALDGEENKDISRTLFYLLFSLPNDDFIQLINASKDPIPVLYEDPSASGPIEIYGYRYRKEYHIPTTLL